MQRRLFHVCKHFLRLQLEAGAGVLEVYLANTIPFVLVVLYGCRDLALPDSAGKIGLLAEKCFRQQCADLPPEYPPPGSPKCEYCSISVSTAQIEQYSPNLSSTHTSVVVEKIGVLDRHNRITPRESNPSPDSSWPFGRYSGRYSDRCACRYFVDLKRLCVDLR